MWKKIAIVFCLASLTGCASVMTDKTQPVKVETMTHAGEKYTGAKCELKNDRGAYNVESPNTVFVRKSAGELVITCEGPEKKHADAKLISRTGGAVFGNIILGGVIGAVVDTASGVAYNYPEWVQLVSGESLTFDRHDFKDAQPTPAKSLPGEGTDSQASTTSKTKTGNTPASPATPAPPVVQKVEYITIVAPDKPQSAK